MDIQQHCFYNYLIRNSYVTAFWQVGQFKCVWNTCKINSYYYVSTQELKVQVTHQLSAHWKANRHCEVIRVWQQCLLSGLSWSCPPLLHSSRKPYIHKCLWQVACGSNGHDICPALGNSYPCLSDRSEQEGRCTWLLTFSSAVTKKGKQTFQINHQVHHLSHLTCLSKKTKTWKTKIKSFVLKVCKKHRKLSNKAFEMCHLFSSCCLLPSLLRHHNLSQKISLFKGITYAWAGLGRIAYCIFRKKHMTENDALYCLFRIMCKIHLNSLIKTLSCCAL